VILALDAVAASALAIAIAAGVAGPFSVFLFGTILRARGGAWALIAAAAALLVRIGLTARNAPAGGKVLASTRAMFRIAILTLLASDAALVLGHLVLSCGGLDSAGYLGAARLFLTGRLTELVPLARVLPFENATAAAAPLGFVPAAAAFHIAPRFPPGLPVVMAAAIGVGGQTAPFYIAPVFGFAAAVLTGLMVRERIGSTAGGLAAVLVASSPVFLDMALQPMSDAPAMFWIVLAAFLVWRPLPYPAAAGVAGGMALLTRPPLALAALTLLAITRWRNRRQAAAFGALVALFVAILLALQWRMYGGPFRSGYGTAGQLFTWASLWPNLVYHMKWLLFVHTPLLAALFAAGLWFDRSFGWRAGAMFLAIAMPYFVYAPRFEDWEILRFLLPGLPFVLAVCACGVVQLAGGDSHPVRARAAALLVAAAASAASYAFVSHLHVFDLRERERKYPLVGEWFAHETPSQAVAIASLHTGSVRYYSGRAIVRMEAVPDHRLGETVGALQRAGYAPYAALEQDELEEFDRRFQPDMAAGLTMEPLARIRGVNIFRLTMR
jgi:hypothetical protein